ncbi:Uncharacterised protein [Mycobacterium tuberculosis]|uniref:Uncharacterized protein n=1 Tax=Mycobacterium tuberculosis TaxID=1773 RepID=A0A0U0R4J4_MYCTX|nr:Uncharacterised protein [Mycobacterium tuberculosis]
MIGLGALDQGRREQRFSGAKPEGGAVFGKHTNTTRRSAGVAHPPSVKDHSVAEQGPLLAFDQLTDRLLHLDRVLCGGPAPPAHQSSEMSIHRDSGDTECVTQDDIGGFAPHPGQRHQLVHGGRHLTAKPLN